MVKNYELRPYPIRIPPEMRENLEAAAKAGNRSLHAEIMSRLEESFVPLPITPEDLLRAIENKIRVSTQPGAEFMLRWASVAVEQKAFIDANRALFEQVIKDNPDIAFLPAIEEVKKLVQKKTNTRRQKGADGPSRDAAESGV